MNKIIIETKTGPQPKGHYSQIVIGGSFIFLSGQLPLKSNGEFVDGDIKVQTTQILENIEKMLKETGSSLEKVLKVSVFISNSEDFKAMNEVYSEFFPVQPPARTTVVVSDFPQGAKIEIDVIALL